MEYIVGSFLTSTAAVYMWKIVFLLWRFVEMLAIGRFFLYAVARRATSPKPIERKITMKNTNTAYTPDYVLHKLGGKVDAFHEVLNALYANGQDDAWNIVYSMFMKAEREYEQAFEKSESYAKSVEWLADPANRNNECYGDIYKDIYGHSPRW